MIDRPSTIVAAQTEECIPKITQRWLYFDETLKFKDDVPLSTIIDRFSMLINEFVKVHYPLLLGPPADLFWMMVFRAIQVSNTHPQEELNKAVRELYQKYRLQK